MIHHFLINPAAGKKFNTHKFTDNISQICKTEGVDFRLYNTTAPFTATTYVSNTLKDLPNTEHRFYACGGDGTLCEAVNGGVGASNAEFAAIPVGTGNDFCRNFSPETAFHDISAQIHGHTLPLDLLKVNDLYSINMINIGFDSDVVVEMNKLRRHALIPNKLAYISGLAVVLFRKLGFKATINLDEGVKTSRELLLMAIANGSFCGGGFHSSPLAAPNDGLMDVALINNISRTTFLKLVPYYKDGTYLEKETAKEFVDYKKAEKMIIEFDEPRSVCVDGELFSSNRVEIAVCKNAINFSIPDGASPLFPCKFE